MVDGGVDVEAMIARAACYGIERATAIAGGDNPKWTLHPANWLKKKRWRDPLPAGARSATRTGNVVGFEHNEPSRPMGFVAIGEAMAREAEERERERRVAADRVLRQ